MLIGFGLAFGASQFLHRAVAVGGGAAVFGDLENGEAFGAQADGTEVNFVGTK